MKQLFKALGGAWFINTSFYSSYLSFTIIHYYSLLFRKWKKLNHWEYPYYKKCILFIPAAQPPPLTGSSPPAWSRSTLSCTLPDWHTWIWLHRRSRTKIRFSWPACIYFNWELFFWVPHTCWSQNPENSRSWNYKIRSICCQSFCLFLTTI